MKTFLLSPDRIAAASAVIDPEFRDTPQFETESIGRMLGCRVVVKVETLNPIRSFKARGGLTMMAALPGRPHLACATAGNFGAGLAYAARKRGAPIDVFMNNVASAVRADRLRALGAIVHIGGETPDDTHIASRAFAAETGATLVDDGSHPAIAEGAGTIGVELLRGTHALDALIVPVGDGALAGGVATWARAHSPTTRMIGVCPTKSPAMEQSWRAGRVVSDPNPTTIADGLSIGTPFAASVAILSETVDDMVLVEDQTMIDAIRVAYRELGLVLEPSGAAGLAALMTYRERFRDQTVGVILTGGNVSDDEMRRWLG